ncbi:N-acetylglucosamine-6-phosphate deacetylase [Aquamicrobium segne]|uniref:N-acetylglucosamine-6-phosphate deacetylase n=1 Tax=Aquamicrobium segne TaxID=469547 RepID=A0ABW0H1E0_9HYPH
MSGHYALCAPRIFDGQDWHKDAALVIVGNVIEAITPLATLSTDIKHVDADCALLAPGFIDLQVNGGGGVMLNDHPDLASIQTICAAHAPFGTTALLPTLITDTAKITAAAIKAGQQAHEQKIPGFLGLHLEGPHLSTSRKGAHDERLIRKMEEKDLNALISAVSCLPVLLTTLAPESVTLEQVEALAKAGVIVSLGHSDASHATACAYARAGAGMVTHLFNAMSPLGNREPGLVGAALDSDTLFTGLIADGIHVDPATISLALRAKRKPAKLFLVTDAMATIGTSLPSFTLNGRTIRRAQGSLRLEDGTLAGADLDMISAVRFMHRTIGLDLGEALRMASLYPAQAIGQSHRLGRLVKGASANITALNDTLDVGSVWIDGAQVFKN